MLPETSFLVGGALSVALGTILTVADLVVVGSAADLSALVGGFMLVGFGIFFGHVGVQARRHRRVLLRIGEGPL